MTQDEIIRMAREAGCHASVITKAVCFNPDVLERFAALVAAHEREKHGSPSWETVDDAIAAEREACAKVCEQIDTAAFGSERPAPNDCAAAIRARGE